MQKKSRLVKLAGTLLAAASLLLFAAACGSDDSNNAEDTPTTVATTPVAGETPQMSAVSVSLAEWSVTPDVTSIPAGPVTFNVANIGAETHEFVVIRTDLAADALPTAADGSVDEAGAGIQVLDEIEDLAAETDQSIVTDVSAGNYVLICNIVDTEMGHVHYDEGMRAAFTVTE